MSNDEALQDLDLLVAFTRTIDEPEVTPIVERLRRALEQQRVPEGHSIVGNNVLSFLWGEAPLFGRWFHEQDKQELGLFWWRKYLPRPAAPNPDGADDEQT